MGVVGVSLVAVQLGVRDLEVSAKFAEGTLVRGRVGVYGGGEVGVVA